MAEISRASLLKDLYDYLETPAANRAVYHNGNCPTYVNRNINGVDPIGNPNITAVPVDIPEGDSISTDDIVRHAAQQALYCTVVRQADYGLYESSSVSRTIKNPDGSYYTIPAGQTRLLYSGTSNFRMIDAYATHSPGDSVSITSFTPGKGNDIKQAEVRNYYSALAANSSSSLSNAFKLDLRVCHSSCHNSCHGSRGRR